MVVEETVAMTKEEDTTMDVVVEADATLSSLDEDVMTGAEVEEEVDMTVVVLEVNILAGRRRMLIFLSCFGKGS